MENRDINNIYAVPFIGGILCIIAFFTSELFLFIGYNIILGMIFFIPSLLELTCGIIMIYIAIKIRSGKTTWVEAEKKLLISSWLAIIIALGYGIFYMYAQGFFVITYPQGFTGGLVTLLGIYYYKHITNRDHVTGPALVQERETLEPSPMKEQQFYADPKFCTNCGFNLEGGTLKFCPDCGNQLTSE